MENRNKNKKLNNHTLSKCTVIATAMKVFFLMFENIFIFIIFNIIFLNSIYSYFWNSEGNQNFSILVKNMGDQYSEGLWVYHSLTVLIFKVPSPGNSTWSNFYLQENAMYNCVSGHEWAEKIYSPLLGSYGRNSFDILNIITYEIR